MMRAVHEMMMHAANVTMLEVHVMMLLVLRQLSPAPSGAPTS